MSDDPLAGLPAEERNVLTMRLRDGLSVLEIARRTNTSRGEARTIAMRALRRLRTVTENEGHPGPED